MIWYILEGLIRPSFLLDVCGTFILPALYFYSNIVI